MTRSRSTTTPMLIGVLLVIVIMIAAVAVLTGGRITGTGGDELLALPVNEGNPAEIRPDDPEAFVAALANVDWELHLGDERKPTANEREAVRSHLGNTEQPVAASMRVATEIAAGGPVVIQFANEAGTGSQCRIVGRPSDDGGLDFLWGHSCWDPGKAVFQQGDEPGFVFSCDAVLGVKRLGLRDFMAEIYFPPGSPGAVVTLADGGTVVVRPTPDNYGIYAGPVPDHIDVYSDDGQISSLRTADCA